MVASGTDRRVPKGRLQILTETIGGPRSLQFLRADLFGDRAARRRHRLVVRPILAHPICGGFDRLAARYHGARFQLFRR
jgi:hypothetical protein